MSNNTLGTDRYVSFCGIQCDENANLLINLLNRNIDDNNGGEKWVGYFRTKLAEKNKTGGDNLHFIGNQLNALYEYFDTCGDKSASDLLYQVEQECC